ncbi:MAG TPA: YceI family protein [Streptosporangiaceae bacterium]|jgi:polyisoprenoid-binding protein YceI
MPTTTAARPALGRYEIDIARSSLTFATRHLFGLAPVHGRFAVSGGRADITEPLAACDVRAEIDAASFHTGNPVRDKAVRSARFLDAARHPVITFVSQRCGPDAIEGTLTVRGVARPVRLAIGELELDAGAFTARASARIDRTDFGVTASRGLAGRYLELTVQVRCVRV